MALSRELADIETVAKAIRDFRGQASEAAELEAMLADPATGAEMRGLAEEELRAVRARLVDLQQDLKIALLPKDVADEKNAILEIRAGTGGDEAALFAGGLFRMYHRYAELKGWHVEILSASEGASGGYKEIVAEIAGRGVFARLKFESGVHRVQRVPETGNTGARSYLGCNRRGLARSRGIRCRYQRSGPEDRYDARPRRRRAACQQDRIRGPHHPFADGHHRLRAGRAFAAQEPRPRDDTLTFPDL